jgi:hypothetical protein
MKKFVRFSLDCIKLSLKVTYGYFLISLILIPIEIYIIHLLIIRLTRFF